MIDHRDGNRRIYQLDPDAVGEMRPCFEQFRNKALGVFLADSDRPVTF